MIILTRHCIECGKEYKFDPADGLPRYCVDCYYKLGLGDQPDVTFNSEEQREMSTENWQGKGLPANPEILEAYLNAETGDEPPADPRHKVFDKDRFRQRWVR